MATQIYPKLKTWWSESHQSVSLENIESMPIFQKLFQIKGQYSYSFREFNESFTEIDGVRVLSIEMQDGKNKEIARFNPLDRSRSYYKLYQHPDHEYELDCRWTDRCEIGTEIKTHPDRTSIIKWEKILDVHSNQEYFPDSKVNLYIFKLTEQVNEDGLTFIKTTSTSFHVYEEHFEKETKKDKTKIIKLKKINKKGKTSCVRTIKSDEASISLNKKTKELSIESFKQQTRDKTFKKKSKEFFHNNSKIQTSKEVTQNSISGFKRFQTNQLNSSYEIKWNIKHSTFFCEIDVVGDSDLCYKKRILHQDNEFLEMEDIKSGKVNWGCINRYFDDSTFHLKWTGEDSQIYDSQIERFRQINTKDIQGPSDKSLYRLVQLATVDTEFIYENLKKIEMFNFYYFSGLSKVIYKEQMLSSYLYPDQLLEEFQERENCRRTFVENLDESKFQEFVLNYSEVNNRTLLVEEYYRLEKYMSFILSSGKLKTKVSYSRNFSLEVYFKLQTWIFDLSYALELIQLINNSSETRSIRLTRNSFIDQSCFSVICTACNSVCHNDCRISLQEIDLDNRKIKECCRFRSFNSRCEACHMNCPAYYHVSAMKSIRVDNVSLSSNEFNHSYEQAEGFISRFKKIVAEDNLVDLMMLKLNHLVFVRQKFLKKSRMNFSESSDNSSELSEEESGSSQKTESRSPEQLQLLKEIEMVYQQISILDEIS